VGTTDEELMESLLTSYVSLSQPMWRLPELNAVKRINMPRPILEIGCGDGVFTRLALGAVDRAIDINPRAVKRASLLLDVYGTLEVADARSLRIPERLYKSVFANCVLEHIDGVDQVLASCSTALEPGGQLVATIPLKAMNSHLAWRWTRYVKWRQRGLVHYNLWATDTWRDRLLAAGFSDVAFYPYLRADLCKIWDLADAPLMLGTGRLRFGTLLRYLAQLVPPPARRRIRRVLACKLVGLVNSRNRTGETCAAVLVATTAIPTQLRGL
jgi:SAM-dependent methyltransferase